MPRTNGRANLAAFGSSLWGFEIKTGRDTQGGCLGKWRYDRVFDWCAIVVAERRPEAAPCAVACAWLPVDLSYFTVGVAGLVRRLGCLAALGGRGPVR